MNKEEKLNDLFRQAREQQPQTSFQETKNLFLNSLESQSANNNSGKGKLFTFKNRIIMSTIIGIITITATILFVQNRPVKEQVATEKMNVKALSSNDKVQKSETDKLDLSTNTKVKKVQHFKLPKLDLPEYLEEKHPKTSKIGLQNYVPEKAVEFNLHDEYIFPKLTEKEIEKTRKQKKKMLKALAKKDNRWYSYIPSGSFEYQGQMISVQAIYMQKTEVSNLEYRTFLFDLLIQDRKEEFLKAKPDQNAWRIALGDSATYMIEHYFSDEVYNDFPVNNISREGAEMYCFWLSKELITYVGEKEAVKYNDLRIPTRQEWVKAASVEGSHKNYAFDGELYNQKLNFHTANFNLYGYTGTIKEGYEKQVKNELFPSSKTYGEKKLIYTCYTWKIKVMLNGYGLYNMTGNVAEMVFEGAKHSFPILKTDSTTLEDVRGGRKFVWIKDDGSVFLDTIPQPKNLTAGTAGGGWMNSAEEIKINAPDNHPNVITAHPNIGFRVVMTHLGRGAYK